MNATSIKFKCGHVDVQPNMPSDPDKFQKRVKWLETKPCIPCQRLTLNEANTHEAQELGLPPLRGSERQRTWANTVRNEKLKDLECWQRKLIVKYNIKERNGQIGKTQRKEWKAALEAFELVRSSWITNNDANFWLDKKAAEPMDYVKAEQRRILSGKEWYEVA